MAAAPVKPPASVKNLDGLLERLGIRISQAMAAAGVPEASPALVRTANRFSDGDFQADGILAAAGRMKTPVKQLAADVLRHLDVKDMAETVTVGGPGFLNIRLRNDCLCACLEAELPALLSGRACSSAAERIVVDLSSPNLAKEMHIGHLRSTVIGDAVARILAHVGHQVIRQNHVGDWGTQFGMLIAYMLEQGLQAESKLVDLEAFYRAAREKFDSDADFAQQARQAVVALQAREASCLALWKQFTEHSLAHCQVLYKRLGVALELTDVRGESAYNDMLPGIIAACEAAGILSESGGAKCIFLDEIKGKDGKPLPLIVQKSDGGYLYATTDLAAIRYRSDSLKADRVLYFVDARQKLHFRQVLAVAEQAALTHSGMTLKHLPFGMVLGKNNKPFKTREGGVVKLSDLLDEAMQRAKALVSQNNPELPENAADDIAAIVGVGAIKYADLSRNPAQDYVFDWDVILSFEGNTGPYLQYAYTRIIGIFRRSRLPFQTQLPALSTLDSQHERALALHLIGFGPALNGAAHKYQPNLLCTYLHELASRFSRFYEHCPVLKAHVATRNNRLRLCQMTGETLATGLSLLGIAVTEHM